MKIELHKTGYAIIIMFLMLFFSAINEELSSIKYENIFLEFTTMMVRFMFIWSTFYLLKYLFNKERKAKE
jgi:hypothetical protein